MDLSTALLNVNLFPGAQAAGVLESCQHCKLNVSLGLVLRPTLQIELYEHIVVLSSDYCHVE